MPERFSDIVSNADKEFLALFTPSFAKKSVDQLRGPTKEKDNMSKLPTSSARTASASRLPPPGSVAKRPREGSIDLEAGLAKKGKMDVPASNLSKSKSKSMVGVNQKFGSSSRTAPTLTGRASLAPPRKPLTKPAPAPATTDRRQTTTALNDRTNVRKGLTREKSSVSKSMAKPSAKVPAWDLKGRMAEMELKLSATSGRLEVLEKEKHDLKIDVDCKKEVVQASSEQIKELNEQVKRGESELDQLKSLFKSKEEELETESKRLKHELDEEKYNKSTLERRLKGVEDELTSKQTEILGLKNSVAELSSSRAGVEAALAGTKTELEAAREIIKNLTTESERKSKEIQANLEEKAEMMKEIRWGETERRKLHNRVQELKGNIRVFCRLRPRLPSEEKEEGERIGHVNIQGDSLELIKTVADGTTTIAAGNNKNQKFDFEFDRVFGPTSSQMAVFEEISQLVQSAMDGYNVCVFAYGQTGSGKTFTMEGGLAFEEDETELGMIPRTIKKIFEEQDKLREKGWEYKLQASFLEIYNEEIKCLLTNDPGNTKYEIKMIKSDDNDKELHVTNLKVEDVTSQAQIASMIKRARKNRAWAKTLCNERSSRSHSVFMMKIMGENSATTETCCSTLNLVDLAGSERIKESGSEGQRLAEAQAINKSLSNLSNVILALNSKNAHVPYRNSKLTHLLQNSLGGNSKTLMFVNISPKEDSFNETLNSLRFATKVNQCQIGTAKKVAK